MSYTAEDVKRLALTSLDADALRILAREMGWTERNPIEIQMRLLAAIDKRCAADGTLPWDSGRPLRGTQ